MAARRPVFLLVIAGLLLAAGAWLAALSLRGDLPPGPVYPGTIDDPPTWNPVTAPPPGAEKAIPVTLELRPKARLLPAWRPPSLRVVRADDGRPVPATVTWLAGTAAVPVAASRWRGRQWVRIEIAGQEPDYRVVRLAPGQAQTEIEVAPPSSLRGRVLDTEGTAIPGAHVWCAGRRATTDGDGAFEVAGVRGRSGLPLIVRAEGKASAFFVIGLDPGAVAPRVFHLQPARHVRVRTIGHGRSGEERVYLAPPTSTGSLATGVIHYPFFAPLLLGAPVPDTDGVFVLDDVPRDGRDLRVIASAPGQVTGQADLAEQRGRSATTVMVRIPQAPTLRGSVVDPGGRPVAGAVVLARHHGATLALPRAADTLLLPPAILLAAFGHAVTGDDGTFTVARPHEDSLITVHARGRIGLAVRVAGTANVEGHTFVLPDTPDLAGEPPGLRVRATRVVRLVVVRGNSRSEARLLGPGDDALLQVREPMLADVIVRSGGAERVLGDLVLNGRIELTVP